MKIKRPRASLDDRVEPGPGWIRNPTMTQPQNRRSRRSTRPNVEGRQPGPATTYRQLVVRGFASSEAANLTAYLHRLPIAEQPWTLRQVNAVLFLQNLRMNGRFGAGDGEPSGSAA
jgi:hypothetical protein